MVTFFADENLGATRRSKFVTVLREHGIHVEPYLEHFEKGLEDYLWLRKCAERDWVVLTQDKSMRKQTYESYVIQEVEVKLYTLIRGRKDHSMIRIAKNFCNSVKNVREQVKNNDGPYIAKVNMATPKKFEHGWQGPVEIIETFKE